MSNWQASSWPSKNPTQAVDFPRLDGGLNVEELDYRLDKNESPNMKNMWWQDGILQSRDGQAILVNAENAGTPHCCCAEPFWDWEFVHIGPAIYRVKPWDTTHNDGGAGLIYVCAAPDVRGTFFRWDGNLYYKTRGAFIRIKRTGTDQFVAESVTAGAYTPVIVINADPETAAGSTYQPENRLSPNKTVWYNAKSGVTKYVLPVAVDSIVEVKVDGSVSTAWSLAADKKSITFTSAPPVTNPATNNTVQITYSKANPGALESVMSCRYAEVYGGTGGLCIVMGGCEAQPNAVFWNSNDSISMNDSYWPMSYYNLVGDTDDAVTGFGKQYSELIVFKERSVGKMAYGVEVVESRNSISLTYSTINSIIGCDLPWTIQLIQNNLVWCNTDNGVHILQSASAAYENNISNISGKVNGSDSKRYLKFDVRHADKGTVCSLDDDTRYWLCVGGHVYLWDYSISTPSKPSWFFFDNIHAVDFFKYDGTLHHLREDGALVQFARIFYDFYDPNDPTVGGIDKVYTFPTQTFGTYDRLKDIMHILLAIRGDTDSVVDIRYDTDYETRFDKTVVSSYSWRLSPRNLSSRHLEVLRYAKVAKRRPGCRHIRHFVMTLSNNLPGQDLAISNATIFYRFTGKER